MVNDNLFNNIGNKAKTVKKDNHNKNHRKKGDQTRAVQVRYRQYKRIKMLSARKDISIVDLMDKAIDHAFNDEIYKNHK